MIFVMVTGALFRSPAKKISKAGRDFVIATVKVVAGNEVEFWTALAFGEAEQAEFLRLAEGEKLAVQGALKLEANVTEGGEIKIRRTVFVDAVLSLKPRTRQREAKPNRADRPATAVVHDVSFGRRDFDDQLPF